MTLSPVGYPTNYQWIFDKQNETNELVWRHQKFPDRYFTKVSNDKELICCAAPGDNSDTFWKFALTVSMIRPTIHWFHAMLEHPGSHRMHAILQAWYHHPHLQIHIEHFICDECQQAKPSGPDHRILLVFLGRKLQLILLTHGQCQHHMVLWNSLPSPSSTPPPT